MSSECGRCHLYHNRGDGTFENVTDKAGVANKGGTGIGGVFVDVDNDGRLDLFVANYLKFDPSYQLYFSADAYRARSRTRLSSTNFIETAAMALSKTSAKVPGFKSQVTVPCQ